MKKLLLSVAGIVVIAGAVTGATIAFYNDTETSTGNIFVAGSIDLKVDHTAQTYNGVDCKTCSVVVQSDTTNMVIEKSSGAGDPVPLPHAAMLVTTQPSTWTADDDPDLVGASWIWATNPTLAADKDGNEWYKFEKKFNWLGPITGATIIFNVGADNSYEVRLNGVLIGSDPTEFNYTNPADPIIIPLVNVLQGQNTLEFKVTNKAGSTGAGQNPGGLIYKLAINGNCGAAYFQNHCELWQSQDLTGQEQFFNFDDIKPGDYGTNVISLNVSSNDAYACLLTSNEDDQDNTVVEPELDLADTGPAGELSQFLKVFAWNDSDNDGVYEGETQLLPVNTPFVDIELLQLSLTGGGPTSYVGLAWCAGTQSLSGNTVLCNGSTMGDIAQTDSFTASLTAYAEQVRNNPNFSCADVELGDPDFD